MKSENFLPSSTQERYPSRDNATDGKALIAGLSNLPTAMRVQGFTSLRPGQDTIVNQVLMFRDTLGVLPTGRGKSACFITPAICHNLKVLIFSPLTALMADQNNKLVRLGLRSVALSGLQSASVNDANMTAWGRGDVQFLYTAPERIRNPDFASAMLATRPDMIVIDEAHVVSNWSDNFREEYKLIGDVIRSLSPRVVLALTATCPLAVEDDIRRVFCLTSAAKLVYYPRRKNLTLNSVTSGTADADFLQFTDHQAEVGQTLVYCATIKNVEKVAQLLQAHTTKRTDMFHGQLRDAEKRAAMDGFMSGETQIMVCTNAFGMGIDKADVRGVVHYDVPACIENAAQEMGRAGRDGLPSTCTMFLRGESLNTQKFFIRNSYADEGETRRVYDYLKTMCKRSPDGVFFATQAAVGKGARVQSVEAPLSMLFGERMVLHEVCSDNPRVKILAEEATPQFMAFKQAVITSGIMENGAYVFDMKRLADRMGCSEATARNRVKTFAEASMIDYTPSARGTKFSINPEGDFNKIDFARVEANKARAFEKLARVERYCYLANSDARHSFIESEFGITKCQME